MSLYPSYEAYNRAAVTERRLKQNRKIDAIVKASIVDVKCDCGSQSLKQKKRGSYIIKCEDCNEEYKLTD